MPPICEEAEKLFRTGRYDECARLVDEELDGDGWSEPWRHLKIKTALATGKYAEASARRGSLRRFPQPGAALAGASRSITSTAANQDARTSSMRSRESCQARRGGTPRPRDLSRSGGSFCSGARRPKVLDQFYDVVTKQQPDFVDAYFATAELALDKQDGPWPPRRCGKPPRRPRGPAVSLLDGAGLSSDDRAGSAKALDEALKINPHHVDSLLLKPTS